MSNKSVLVLHDGKPGHITQSLGLAQLLAKHYQLDIYLQHAKLRAGGTKKLARRLCMGDALEPQKLIRSWLYKLGEPELVHRHGVDDLDSLGAVKVKKKAFKPDLIVSFGGKLVALNVAMARCFEVPNLLIGNNHKIPYRHFSAVLRAQTKEKQDNLIQTGVTFCAVDAQWALQEGEQFKRNHLKSKQVYWTLLIGGDGSGYHYTSNDWSRLGQLMRRLSAEYGIRWLVTTSRRTGKDNEKLLRQALPLNLVDIMVYFGGDSANLASVHQLLGAGERLFVTEDSLSMLTEAVAMLKPVYSLRSEAFDKHKHHVLLVKSMQQSGLLQRLQLQQPNRLVDLRVDDQYPQVMDQILRQLEQLGVLKGFQLFEPSNLPE